ncbi:hypothetical protein V7128_01485 [Neobacillus vireti]|jgi:hypothetical protein
MSKKEQFLQQIREVETQLEQLEELREDLYKRLDVEIEKDQAL